MTKIVRRRKGTTMRRNSILLLMKNVLMVTSLRIGSYSFLSLSHLMDFSPAYLVTELLLTKEHVSFLLTVM